MLTFAEYSHMKSKHRSEFSFIHQHYQVAYAFLNGCLFSPLRSLDRDESYAPKSEMHHQPEKYLWWKEIIIIYQVRMF